MLANEHRSTSNNLLVYDIEGDQGEWSSELKKAGVEDVLKKLMSESENE